MTPTALTTTVTQITVVDWLPPARAIRSANPPTVSEAGSPSRGPIEADGAEESGADRGHVGNPVPGERFDFVGWHQSSRLPPPWKPSVCGVRAGLPLYGWSGQFAGLFDEAAAFIRLPRI